MKKHDDNINKALLALIAVAAIVMIFNQVQVKAISGMLDKGVSTSRVSLAGAKDLSDVDIDSLSSTAQTIAAVFPVAEFQSSDDAMAAMFPTGTPEYGAQLGVSFDDPVQSLDKLSKMFRGLKTEVEKGNPEAFQRFINLASKPKGVSCEYCCGVGPIGADSKG